MILNKGGQKIKHPQNHDSGTLERLFGSSATARILDFMHIFRDWDYSKQDIARNSDVSFRHALKAIDKLAEVGLIKKTRTIGRAQMYQYNMENPAAQLLQKFALELAYQESLKIAAEEIAKEDQAKQVKAETIPA
jgi:predicted transcriptional regulator